MRASEELLRDTYREMPRSDILKRNKNLRMRYSARTQSWFMPGWEEKETETDGESCGVDGWPFAEEIEGNQVIFRQGFSQFICSAQHFATM